MERENCIIMNKKISYLYHKAESKYNKHIRILLAVLGMGLLAWGIVRGDCQAIFGKAIFVCLECVGIG